MAHASVQRETSRASHGHSHGGGPLGWLAAIFHLHGHEHAEHDLSGDPAFATREGIRTIWIALGALALTTVLQILIVLASGSVALLADTVHNFGDMLNSIPLLVAFYLSRRMATRRYTYGYGRAEDVAGVVIVLSIVFSAGYILWESFGKLFDPEPIAQLPWVAAAAVIGFLGNEAVAWFQIRTGNRIGSASLVADGLHARIDGLTSLVVLIAVAGSVAGVPHCRPDRGIADRRGDPLHCPGRHACGSGTGSWMRSTRRWSTRSSSTPVRSPASTRSPAFASAGWGTSSTAKSALFSVASPRCRRSR